MTGAVPAPAAEGAGWAACAGVPITLLAAALPSSGGCSALRAVPGDEGRLGVSVISSPLAYPRQSTSSSRAKEQPASQRTAHGEHTSSAHSGTRTPNNGHATHTSKGRGGHRDRFEVTAGSIGGGWERRRWRCPRSARAHQPVPSDGRPATACASVCMGACCMVCHVRTCDLSTSRVRATCCPLSNAMCWQATRWKRLSRAVQTDTHLGRQTHMHEEESRQQDVKQSYVHKLSNGQF
jgi:hypothetical protein